MSPDAVSNSFAGLNIRCLNVDGSNPQLSIPQVTLKVRGHIMLDQIGIAFDPANQVRLVAPFIEIAVTDLAVVIWANRIVALANMDGHMNVVGNIFDDQIDHIYRGRDFSFG